MPDTTPPTTLPTAPPTAPPTASPVSSPTSPYAIPGRPKADAPFVIVLNAGSGRDDAADARRDIEAVLQAAGRAHRLLLVEDGRQLPDVAQQAVAIARGCGGIVVAAGGDGTINAVTQAVLGSGCVMGIVPQGTFNYTGRAQGLSLVTREATQQLLTGQPQPVQVGLVNDRAFLVNASLGLYPQVLEDREAYKQRYGRRRVVALWSGLVTLLHAHRPLRLTLAGAGPNRAVRTPTLFVGNNRLQLEQIGIPEAPALAQRQLVAITLKPVSTLAMLWLMLRGALGQLGEARAVFSFAFGSMSVQPAAPLGRRKVKVAVDGEILHLRAPLVFRVSPEPLLLIKPGPITEDAAEPQGAAPVAMAGLA